MLPPFIIEQIRKREELDRDQRIQPTIDIPLPRRPQEPEKGKEDGDRGVVVIDLL